MTTSAPGLNDDWLRIHWLRDGFELLLGDPSWPLHDFRHLLRGRLGNPTAPDLKTIEFPIADMSEALQAPLVTARISSGDWINQFKPAIFGQPFAVELVGDRATLVYYVNDGAIYSGNNDGANLYDVTTTAFVHIGGVAGMTMSSVNAGTGEITTTGAHGLLNGFRVRFPSGTPPLGMSINTNYWVVGTTPGSSIYKLSATQGGAAITGGGTGTVSYDSFGYTYDTTNGTVTLVSAPAGRIIAFSLSGVESAWPTSLLAAIFFDQLGLSLNYKDAASFTAALAVDATDAASTGYFVKTGTNETALAAASNIAAGNCAWFGLSLEGLMQTGSRALPAATAVLSLDRSDISDIRLTDTIRPINFASANVAYGPWFTVGGPLTTPGVNVGGYSVTSQTCLQGRTAYPAYSYGAAGIPLDDHPTEADPRDDFSFLSHDTISNSIPTRLVNFYKHKLGVFEIATKLKAIEVNIGDTISVDFPRLGFKQWSASDPASPDNTATIDSRLCVVIGISVNLDAKPAEKVRLKVFRRIPGYYPTSNLN